MATLKSIAKGVKEAKKQAESIAVGVAKLSSKSPSRATRVRDESGNIIPLLAGEDVERATARVKSNIYTPPEETELPPSELPPESISTTQPTPETVQATPFTKPDFLKGIGYAGTADLGKVTPAPQAPSRYEAAAQQAIAAGTQAPQTPAEGRALATLHLPAAPMETEVIDTFVAEDPTWQSIQKIAEEYFSPINQKETLLEEYDRLSQEVGLEQLDREIIDAKTIIEGTEDDIRNEVEAAGGFATDSQVMAMSLARNKSLLKNYNNLVAMRDQTQNRLNLIAQLSQQERQMAQQRLESQLNLMFKVADFQRQAQNNVYEQYQWLAGQIGIDGLAKAYENNPRQTRFIESIMGLGTGGLAMAGAQAAQSRISGISKAIPSGKPVTSATALALADSQAAVDMLDSLQQTIEDNRVVFGPVRGRLGAVNPYATRSQTVQSSINATKQIVGKYLEGGVLRAEDEMKYAKILPTLSDTPTVAANKLAAVRNLVDAKIRAQSDVLSQQGYVPYTSESGGGTIVVGPDGLEYEITD